MSRASLVRIFGILLGLAAFFLLWSFAYELVVAARFNPAMQGEGTSRFGLLKAQNANHEFSGLFMAWDHFRSRVFYPGTQAETLLRGAIAALSVILLGAGIVIARYAMRRPMPYGDAKFGTLADAEKRDLCASKGLFLGTLNGARIVSDDPSHVLVVGPTRSGKGVSFIIPNGYMWEGSSVWFDPKRENYDAIAYYRKSRGDKVFIFSPGEKSSHRFNPLDFIRRDERMPTDCSVVASFLVPEGVGSSEIWARSARQLLSVLIGYVVAAPNYEGRRHMRSVSLLTSTGKDLHVVLTQILKNDSGKLPSWIIQGFNQFIALEPETRNSAFFNLTTALNPWTSDLIASVTSASDFDISQLRRTPMALFIGCSVAQLDVYRPIIKLLVQQIHDVLMGSMPGSDEPHQVLMMIDEFRQLGRMESLVSKLAINLGYGFRMVIVLQDLSQLDEVYSKPVRISTVSACQTKLFIRINDLETSQYVSEMLGMTTAEIRTPIIRANQGVFSRRDKSVSYQERPLMTAEKLRQLPTDKAILFVPNTPGFCLTKAAYFKDKLFRPVYLKFSNSRLPVPDLPRWIDIGPSDLSQPAPVLDRAPPLSVKVSAKSEADQQKLAVQAETPAPPKQADLPETLSTIEPSQSSLSADNQLVQSSDLNQKDIPVSSETIAPLEPLIAASNLPKPEKGSFVFKRKPDAVPLSCMIAAVEERKAKEISRLKPLRKSGAVVAELVTKLEDFGTRPDAGSEPE